MAGINGQKCAGRKPWNPPRKGRESLGRFFLGSFFVGLEVRWCRSGGALTLLPAQYSSAGWHHDDVTPPDRLEVHQQQGRDTQAPIRQQWPDNG
jgi:hypothetical protein